jgi:hypothetical protein
VALQLFLSNEYIPHKTYASHKEEFPIW